MAASSGRSRKLYDCTPICTPFTLELMRAKAESAGAATSAILENVLLEYICGVYLTAHLPRSGNQPRPNGPCPATSASIFHAHSTCTLAENTNASPAADNSCRPSE